MAKKCLYYKPKPAGRYGIAKTTCHPEQREGSIAQSKLHNSAHHDRSLLLFNTVLFTVIYPLFTENYPTV